MADRRRQIELLIATRFDLLWFPAGTLRTTGGLAPGERTPCPDCGGVLLHDDFGKTIRRQKGKGFVTDRFKRREPCSTCGGRLDDDGGLVKGSGWIERDTYAPREVVGSAGTQATARPRKTVHCDACGGEGATARGRCNRCNGSGRRDEHVFDLHLDTSSDRAGADAIDIAIDRRDQAGSYHELDHALAALTRARPYIMRLLDQAYLHRTLDLDRLPKHGHRLIDIGIAYVDARMPDPIRVPKDVRDNTKEHARIVKGAALNGLSIERRNAQIRRWEREGKPRQWIGQKTGLSDRQLREIINGTRDDSRPPKKRGNAPAHVVLEDDVHTFQPEGELDRVIRRTHKGPPA